MPTTPLPLAGLRARLRAALAGPSPALPPWLDRLSEWWASRPPRVRLALVLALLLAATLLNESRVRGLQERWGGPPREVLVATEDLWVGEVPTGLEPVLVPAGLVPDGAVTDARVSRPLAMALPAGAVLTERHLDARGPAAGLAAGLRALPVPVEEGWGLTAGGWVDVWVLGEAGGARRVARARPVVDVRGELDRTALVGMSEAEVEEATRGLARDRLLLTHAPPP